MKKTFRKALACILAVLMVAFSVPFASFAATVTSGEANQKWWDDDALPTETPEFTTFNSTATYGRAYNATALKNATNHPKRWNARPIVAVTVSNLGTADSTIEEMTELNDGFYGKVGFTEANDAGRIIDPTNVKAGQRIAVTYEIGGFDLINNGQIMTHYNADYLQPGSYWDIPLDYDMDTWDTGDDGFATAFYEPSNGGNAVVINPNLERVEDAVNSFSTASVAVTAKAATAAATTTSSNFFGKYTHIEAKYGLPVGTFCFEVKQDCDLTKVIEFATDEFGTEFEMIHRDVLSENNIDDLYLFTMDETPRTSMRIAPPIWTNASSAPQPEVHEHDYQEVSRTAPTCENPGEIVKECKSTTGTCDTPTITETIEKLGHDYKSEVTTPASCKEEGVMTWTCQNPEATCERHSYTTPIPKTDHDYQNAEVERKAATCTEDGYVIKADVCTVCGAEKADTRVTTKLDATDHAWGEWIIDTPATETSVGSKHRVCANDPTHIQTEEIPMVECKHEGATHEVDVEVIKAATCKDEGLKRVNVICDVCNNVIETKEVSIPVDATNHVGTTHTEDVITKAATCQETGLKNVVTICDDCGEPVSTVTDVVIDKDPANHVGPTTTRDVVTKEDTCGETGLKNIETVCGCGEVISTEYDVVIPITKQHTPGEPVVTRVEATLDAPGSITTVVKCTVCDAEISKDVQPIAQLKGYTVTVDAADMGKVTLNGTDVSEGAAIKVLAGSQITLTAEPTDGATFVGWTANGKTLVSTDAEFTTTALANVTYTPVFDVVEEAAFTVTFVDAFGNIVAIVDSAALNADAIPTAPARAGYAYATDNGWSMTNEEILGRTENTTVSAQYVKAEEVLYTVNAAGCEITANGETANDTVSVPYDTKVTVTNTTATAWIVKDAKTGEEIKVGYGDSYTFFVTADITLTFDTESVDATPQVVNIGKSSVGTAPRIQAAFKATRTMTDDCQYIASGFVYGKGDLGEITLDNVDGKAIKAIYSKTDSEQFTLTYGLSAQQGTITAVAFLAYVDANGQNQVKYAAPMTYTYGE